jgi:hypothetical protein
MALWTRQREVRSLSGVGGRYSRIRERMSIGRGSCVKEKRFSEGRKKGWEEETHWERRLRLCVQGKISVLAEERSHEERKGRTGNLLLDNGFEQLLIRQHAQFLLCFLTLHLDL